MKEDYKGFFRSYFNTSDPVNLMHVLQVRCSLAYPVFSCTLRRAIWCQSCKSQPQPPIVMVLIIVYSSVPYLLPSLPNPLCFTPPNGAAGSLIIPVFTPTMPTSSASATLHIRPMSRLKKYP